MPAASSSAPASLRSTTASAGGAPLALPRVPSVVESVLPSPTTSMLPGGGCIGGGAAVAGGSTGIGSSLSGQSESSGGAGGAAGVGAGRLLRGLLRGRALHGRPGLLGRRQRLRLGVAEQHLGGGGPRCLGALRGGLFQHGGGRRLAALGRRGRLGSALRGILCRERLGLALTFRGLEILGLLVAHLVLAAAVGVVIGLVLELVGVRHAASSSERPPRARRRHAPSTRAGAGHGSRRLAAREHSGAHPRGEAAARP
mmetsp:Transcript_107017/g.279443  ORF Transcript_107017/g.279443 Transcript_107017/m.279443 type:complete len:256 (+) Transcript_107017:157-924(+)